MGGRISGVQARINSEYPKAAFIHCVCHSLNLTVQDSCKGVSCIRSALDVIQGLSNPIKYSGKQRSLLEKIRQDLTSDGSSLRPLCPTRWAVKAKYFESVLLNYEALLEILHKIVSEKDDNFVIVAKAGGIHKNIGRLRCLFGIMLGEKFFGMTNSLNSSLQGKNVMACDVKAASNIVCEKLVKMREDAEFDALWEHATTKAEELQLNDPILPRVWRPPRRVDSGSSPSTFPSPKD